ncbi:MAG: hypothetical protein QOE11_586 [Solirubrobacteraceae bacterium]|nr:hypothetical protein [Solirubrobacteraceae bacterium]
MRARLERGDPNWPAQLTVAVVIALNLALPERVTAGPKWVVPGVALALLVALVVIAPSRASVHLRGVRRFALTVIGLVSAASIFSLVLLVHFLINGGRTAGHQLILAGVVLWITNVLLFAVWYWEMDRGGPAVRFTRPDALPDFQFTQMENPRFAPPGWQPGFVDYLYLSLTNATAFSPTDTLPLTQTAKLVMAMQSVAALMTIGLVVARAVNILG